MITAGELVLLFEIDGRQVALPAVQIKSVIEISKIFPVPLSPPHVAGLGSLRSQTLTIIDSCKALGLENEREWHRGDRSPVVELNGYHYALLVDRVDDVVEAQSGPISIACGTGKAWDHIARGMVETRMGAALLIDIACLIDGISANIKNAA